MFSDRAKEEITNKVFPVSIQKPRDRLKRKEPISKYRAARKSWFESTHDLLETDIEQETNAFRRKDPK